MLLLVLLALITLLALLIQMFCWMLQSIDLCVQVRHHCQQIQVLIITCSCRSLVSSTGCCTQSWRTQGVAGCVCRLRCTTICTNYTAAGVCWLWLLASSHLLDLHGMLLQQQQLLLSCFLLVLLLLLSCVLPFLDLLLYLFLRLFVLLILLLLLLCMLLLLLLQLLLSIIAAVDHDHIRLHRHTNLLLLLLVQLLLLLVQLLLLLLLSFIADVNHDHITDRSHWAHMPRSLQPSLRVRRAQQICPLSYSVLIDCTVCGLCWGRRDTASPLLCDALFNSIAKVLSWGW